MNFLIVSHAYAAVENQAFLKHIAELYPDDRVTVVVPTHWATDRYGPDITFTPQNIHQGNYRVIPLPLTLMTRSIRYYRGLGQLLRETHPDILYIAQERFDWSTLCALLAAQVNSPATLRIGGTTTNIDYRIKHLHHWLKEKYFFASCHALISMNQEARWIAQQHGFRRPILVQHGIGVDERLWKLRRDQDENTSKRQVCMRAGFVGAFSPEKGVADLLRAVAKIQGEVILELVGDGPRRGDLEREVERLDIKEQVVFRGFQPRSIVMEFMPNLDVLVLPSRSTKTWKEQFGLVLAEAMISGVAVIGSDSGAIPEVIGDAGLIFSEGDVDGLAAHLQRLVADPDYRRNLAARGVERARANFSTTALVRDFRAFCLTLKEKAG
ncbi:MAG: glycosyltransferase family 4 protein [Aggregatilineales bacterium]